MTRHLGIRRYHQLDVPRVGEKALLSAWGSGVCAGGVVGTDVSLLDGGS